MHVPIPPQVSVPLANAVVSGAKAADFATGKVDELKTTLTNLKDNAVNAGVNAYDLSVNGETKSEMEARKKLSESIGNQ